MKPMFEVGQKVMIRPDLTEGSQFNLYYVNSKMQSLAGTIVTILECYKTKYGPQPGIIDGYRYEIKEDVKCSPYHFNWTADCFVQIEENIDPIALLNLL